MKNWIWIILLIGIILLPDTYAEANGCWRGRYPYGDYCRGHRWGWYGERRAVATIEEAKKIIKEHLAPFKNVRLGNIEERRWYFEVEIRDKEDKLIDKVIVDKRTGRIRSTF